MRKKSQVSIEYMAIVGFVTFIALFLLVTSRYYTRQTEDQVISNQVFNLAGNIVDASESVFYYGNPTKTQVDAYMPEKVEEILINTTSIIFKVRTGSGINDIVRYSDVNITGSISTTPGLKKIIIESKGDFVNITSI